MGCVQSQLARRTGGCDRFDGRGHRAGIEFSLYRKGDIIVSNL